MQEQARKKIQAENSVKPFKYFDTGFEMKNTTITSPTSKYKAKKVKVDGMVFDSQKEYRRYCELQLLEMQGIISELKRQVRYELIPSQRGERPVTYIADFVYMKDGNKVVEDVKGMKTDTYVIKRKLMLWVHDIRIQEV